MTYNLEKLRIDLVDECLAAMFSGLPVAIVDLTQIEKADKNQLLQYAKKFGLNLDKYQIR